MSEMNNQERELPHFNYEGGRSNLYKSNNAQANLCSNRVFQCTIILFLLVALCLLAIAVALPLSLFNISKKGDSNNYYYYSSSGPSSSTPNSPSSQSSSSLSSSISTVSTVRTSNLSTTLINPKVS